MATIKGFQANEIKPQPGFAPKQSENGGWTGTHSFVITRQAFDNTAVRSKFAKGTAVTTLDPDVPAFFSFMTLDAPEVSFGVGGFVTITATFAGAESGQFDGEGLGASSEPTYEFDGSTAETHISNHPKWVALGDLEKEALGALLDGTMTFSPELEKVCRINGEAATREEFFDPFLPYDEIIVGDTLEFAKRIAVGTVTYERPAATWTERTEGTEQLTPSQLNKLGNISTPRGNPPALTGGRNWKLSNAYQTQTGSKFTTHIVWTMSEKGGHDEFLYDD